MLAARTPFQAFPDQSAWYHHTQGMISLIQLRGPEQFNTRRGRNLFWVTFEHVVRIISLRYLPDSLAPCSYFECPPGSSLDWRQRGVPAYLLAMARRHRPFIEDEDRSALAIYSFLLDASVFIPSALQVLHELTTLADAVVTVRGFLERLAVIETTDLPYYLLSRFPMQRYLWNNYRCVRALLHHTVVQLLD